MHHPVYPHKRGSYSARFFTILPISYRRPNQGNSVRVGLFANVLNYHGSPENNVPPISAAIVTLLTHNYVEDRKKKEAQYQIKAYLVKEEMDGRFKIVREIKEK